jgi:hypothetical protein
VNTFTVVLCAQVELFALRAEDNQQLHGLRAGVHAPPPPG